MTTRRTVATLCAALLAAGCHHDISQRPSNHVIVPVVVEVTPPAPEPSAEAPAGRALTDAEIALLRPLFGDSIDYAAVRIVHARFLPFQDDDTFMTPQGSIYAPGPLFVEDFAATDVGPWRQAMYVHEMTHVWQHQRGIDVIAGALDELARTDGDYRRAYAYTLAPGRDLLDYSLEQAATILEDYFLLHAHGVPPYGLQDPPSSDQARDALYAEVLGAFLVDPSYRP